jgi:hypothetical protein
MNHFAEPDSLLRVSRYHALQPESKGLEKQGQPVLNLSVHVADQVHVVVRAQHFLDKACPLPTKQAINQSID